MNTQALERAATKTATVTVQFVNAPKPPRKSGSIKDVDGQFFGVWPTMLAQFQEGETYEIEYTEKTVNGVVYRDVKSAQSIQAVDPEEFRAPAPQPPRPKPQPQRSALVQQPAPQNGNGNNNFYRPTSPQDKKSMFRCACVTAAIKSRQVALTRDALAELIGEVDAAYDMAIPDLAAG